MASTIGTAYVQIMPSTEGMKANLTSVMDGPASDAGASAGNSFAGKFKSFMIKAGIATAFTKVLKSALSAGADLQQSYMGGVGTIYGEAADTVRSFAKEAASYGISMNDYSEQAVSFGAALKQAYGGDAVKAAEAANTAIQDMADNQAKMGTDIESIQMAYQGFAKQNYTMLDNLKLGYGGTKTEMERLLADAEKISGVKYDISNLGDVYDAIHVIQGDLGLTGVAAQEASTTFSGSMNAMKAAASNFVGSLALGEDVGPALDTLLQSVSTFVNGNLLPMLGTIGQSIIDNMPEIITGIAGIVSGIVNYFIEHREELVNAGGDLINAIIEGVTGQSSTLGTTISTTINSAFDALGTAIQSLTDWWNSLDPGMQSFITKLGEVAIVAIPVISAVSSIGSKVGGLVTSIGGIIGKFTSFGSAATAATPGISGVSSTLATLTQNALGLVAAGAGILMASAGLALLANAAVQLAAAGPGAAVAMVAMTAAIAGMAVGAAALAPALTAGAVGLVAFGAGLALIGASVLLACAGLTLLSGQLPTICTYGTKAAATIVKMGTALVVFSAGAISGGAGALVLAAGALAAVVGVAALDVVMAPLAVEMATIGISAQSAADNLSSMVTSVDIVETGLSALGNAVTNILSQFASAFASATPTVTANATALAQAVTTTINAGLTQMIANTTVTMNLMAVSVQTSMTRVYSIIENMMDRSLNKIRSSIAEMQNAFASAQFSFNSYIKLPHFSMNGVFDAESGSVPTISVNWYKAGGILTSPTIFGLNGSSFMGGGESGPEAVLPIDNLKTYISDALDEHDEKSSSGFNQTVIVNSPTSLSPAEVARQTRNATRQMVLALKGA